MAKTPRKAGRNDGRWLEQDLQDALHEYCAEKPGFWHRFPDTRAARNFIAAQPADFLWAVPGGALLVEAKSTVVSARLKELLDPNQIAKHRLWHRAGHESVFIYGDRALDVLEAWDGRSVVQMYLTPRHLCAPFFMGNLKQYRNLLDRVRKHVEH